MGGRRMLATVLCTALSTLSTATAFAKAPDASGSWPPAPDPRGTPEQQRAAAKAKAEREAATAKAAKAEAEAEIAAAAKAQAEADAAAAAKATAVAKAAAAAAAKAAKEAPPAAPATARGAVAPAALAPSSGIASVVPETPTEKKAAKMSADALGPIYRARGYQVSESKLRDAIRICGPEVCSQPFQARLHRDLGYLYVDGMKRVDDGKDEFTLALTLDPTVILTNSMLSLAVTQAFAETKKQVEGAESAQAAASAPPPAPPPPPPVQSKSVGDTDSSESSERVENWVSLSLQQDFVFHSQTLNVCATAGSPYECFDASSPPQRVLLNPGDYVPGSNQISKGGPILATTRIFVGYDRVVLPNVTVGGRLGSVIAGKGLRMVTDTAFAFLHVEARAALVIGSDPFSKNGFRPYLYLSGGYGEADGKITVDYILATNPGVDNKAVAWKRSGHIFVSPGLGIQYAIAKTHGPLAEVRYMQFMSPSVSVIAVNVGYSVGF